MKIATQIQAVSDVLINTDWPEVDALTARGIDEDMAQNICDKWADLPDGERNNISRVHNYGLLTCWVGEVLRNER